MSEQHPRWSPSATDSSDETVWAVLTHLSFFVASLVGPLVVLLTVGKRSAYVRHHAREALNFHLTVLIGLVLSIVLVIVLVGFLTLLVIGMVSIVLTVLAAVEAGRGNLYRYPLTLRLVR